MRRLLFFSFCFLSCHLSFAQGFTQKPWFDSLYSNTLNVNKDSANQIYKWNLLAEDYKFNRPDSAIYFSTKALALSRSINYVVGELDAMHLLVLSYITLGNDSKALRISLEGLKKAKQLNIEQFEAFFLLDLGNSYLQSEDYNTSLFFYQQAHSFFQLLSYQNFTMVSAAQLGKIHFELNQVDSAFYYSQKAIKIKESESIISPLPYTRLGEIYSRIGNSDSAFFYFKKALLVPRERATIKTNVLLEMAKLFRIQGQLDSCILYSNDALQIALDNKIYPQIIDTYLFLSEFYENRDASKALSFNKAALAFTDSLANLAKMSSYKDFKDFDEQQRQYEVEVAKKESRDQAKMNALIGSSFTLLLIAFFLYRSRRAKQKSKEQIEGAYNQLKSTQAQLIQSEKMASLGELTAGIAHEIQNPLNFVNNFSEVSGELVDEMNEELEKGDIEEAKFIGKDLKDNLSKITLHGKRADAIVKGMLEHSKRGSGQKELTNLNTLADEFLRLSYQSFLAKEPDFKCELKTDLAPDLPKVSVIPQDIGKVLLNLINNAFYAVHEKASSGNVDSDYKPIVTVRSAYSPLQGGKGGRVELSVQDNGSGIPDTIKDKIFQPFFTTKPTGSGTGLGLSLSYDIVKAHGGKIKMETNEGFGTEFTIFLPLI
jgi:two-component system NtrC family sensor kinase